MQEFDTSMTNTQFKAYYTNRNEELLKSADGYRAELTTISSQIAPIKVNIQRIRPNLQQAQYTIDALNRQKSSLENSRNQYVRLSNSGNIFTRRWLRSLYVPRVNQANAALKDNSNRIQTAQQNLNALTAEMNNYKSTLKQLEATESTINKNKNRNDNDRVILIKQQFYYGRREEACRELSAVIATQETLLNQYNAELTELNKQYTDCKAKYDNTCSADERNALTKLIADRDDQSKQLEQKYAEYDNDCKDKIQDCEPLNSIYQQKLATYNHENDNKNRLDEEYKTCIDPKKNKCKDIYNDTNFNKSMTETNVDMLKPATTKSSEGFTQFNMNDNADETHAKLVANYKSVQNDYTKLKNNVQELNSANNNDVSKTSRYANKKQLYDNAIYTNILLTALATSIVYYIFTDL